jgi:hypothetical protein
VGSGERKQFEAVNWFDIYELRASATAGPVS